MLGFTGSTLMGLGHCRPVLASRQTIDAELTYGLTEATDHHSYQFNRTIQTNWVFYRDALRPLLEP